MTTATKNKISKLDVTRRQWKEIMDKEMKISADLRNQERATEAFKMMIKLESMIKELEIYG